MTCLGILGGSLGLALGAAGGLLSGSARSAGVASLAGGLVGGAFGAGTARLLVPLYFRNYPGAGLGLPLLVHGGLWASVCFAAGLAFGLGLGGFRRAIEASILGIVGAVLAAMTYELAGIWLFPAAQTDRPLPPSSGSRMFACLVVVLITAAAWPLEFPARSTQLPRPNPTQPDAAATLAIRRGTEREREITMQSRGPPSRFEPGSRSAARSDQY